MQVALLTERDVGVTAAQVAIEHLAVSRGALEQPGDAVVGVGWEFELVQDAGSRAGPVGAGDREAFGVGVAAVALHPDLAGTQRAAQLAE